MEIKPEQWRMVLEYIFGPRSFTIHSKKSNFGPQSLIIHQFGSNYWTTKLFNMVDGMKIAMENET